MKRVVIIGGGFAGSVLAKKLENKLEVYLIDNKDYFEFTPGILRAIAHPTASRCMQVSHKDYLKKTKIIKGIVKEVNKEYIVVNGKKITYDYLVVATGSSYLSPFKHPQLFVATRAKELALHNKKLLKSNNILIIGGGLVGVELAGEIVYYFPEKKVTIVNATEDILGRMDVKARNLARDYLSKAGVQILFNQRIDKHTGKVFTTTTGTKVKTDIAFACIGITPNNALLNKNFKSTLDERGFAIVDESLRLNGASNIFIAGDLTNIREEKTAQNAENHGKVIYHNILRSIEGKELLKYEPKSGRPMLLSLGPRNGIFISNKLIFSGIIPAVMKWGVEKKEMIKKKF